MNFHSPQPLHRISNTSLISLVSLCCFFPIIAMGVDLLSPALPVIAGELALNTSTAQALISLYLVGYALGNFCSGLMTDSIGRKRLLTPAYGCLLLVSLLPMLQHSILLLLCVRLLQGLSLGTVAVVSRAIISDLLPKSTLVRLGPIFGTAWNLGTVTGPILGGFFTYYLHWQACFYFFSAAALLAMLSSALLVPETLREKHKIARSSIKKNICRVLHCQRFVALLLLMGLFYGQLSTFHSVAPFILQYHYAYNSLEYGKLMVIINCVFLAATLLSYLLLKYIKLKKVFATVLSVAMLFLFVSLGYLQLTANNSLLLFISASFAVFIVNGLLFSLCISKGLSLFQEIVGIASAIMFLSSMLLSAVICWLAAFLAVNNELTMLYFYNCVALASLATYYFLYRHHR